MQQWWFIDTQYYQYFLNMFRVPLHPSSGGQIGLRVAAWGNILVTVNTSRHPTRRNQHSYNQNLTP
jgi:hypothetical protein